jgi:hypothetical protein
MKRAAGHTTITNIRVNVSYSIFSPNSFSILILKTARCMSSKNIMVRPISK